MIKGFYEVTLDCDDGKVRTYRCCGVTQNDAINKLLRDFPGSTVIKVIHLHDYED